MIRNLCIGLFIAFLMVAALAGAGQGTWKENFDAGRRHLQEGRYVEADKHMSLALKQAQAGEDLHVTLNQLSLIRHELGRYDEAIDLTTYLRTIPFITVPGVWMIDFF